MKQMTSPEQMANLSPIAKTTLHKWMKDKDYGSEIEGDFIPFPQLTIGQLFEFISEHNENEMISIDMRRENIESLCDTLFQVMKDILEEKN